MGEANFYYFTCLKKVDKRLTCYFIFKKLCPTTSQDVASLRFTNDDFFSGGSPLPGRICHGGHRSCWYLFGNFSERWRSAGCRTQKHPQASGRGVYVREDLPNSR